MSLWSFVVSLCLCWRKLCVYIFNTDLYQSYYFWNRAEKGWGVVVVVMGGYLYFIMTHSMYIMEVVFSCFLFSCERRESRDQIQVHVLCSVFCIQTMFCLCVVSSLVLCCVETLQRFLCCWRSERLCSEVSDYRETVQGHCSSWTEHRLSAASHTL